MESSKVVFTTAEEEDWGAVGTLLGCVHNMLLEEPPVRDPGWLPLSAKDAALLDGLFG